MSEMDQLHTIMRATIETIQQNQQQMFNLAENIRHRYQSLKGELQSIQLEITDVMEQLDTYAEQELEALAELSNVKNNIEDMDADVKRVYEKDQNLRREIASLRDREQLLREKKVDCEDDFRAIRETMGKAEELISHIGVALEYLNGNLEHIWVDTQEAQDKSSMVLAIIKAQEEERKRVARDIHDGPAQSVANLVLQVEYCQKLLEIDPSKVREELDQLKSVARGNLENIRKIIFALRPMDLDDLGLVPAIKRYLCEFERTNKIAVDLQVAGSERRYISALEIAVFRIIQESLNNVVKHSKASKVKVVIETQTDFICAFVRDDGIGFNLDEGVGDDSFGLQGMKERTAMLNGEFEISSARDEGTEVFVRIPVREEDQQWGR